MYLGNEHKIPIRLEAISKMFELIGVQEEVYQEKINGNFKSSVSERIIALFSTEKLGKKYIKKARLKKEKGGGLAPIVRYKKCSLLDGCCDAWIQLHIPSSFEIDPTI